MPMTYVTVPEINQYLSNTKLELDGAADEEVLEASEKAYVFSRVGSTYDTTDWTDAATTPLLVRSIIAMRVAGRIYLRQLADYSADSDQYGRMLLADADSQIQMINDEVMTLDLVESVGDRTSETYEFVDPLFTVGNRF